MTGHETVALAVGLAGVAWVLGSSIFSDIQHRRSRKPWRTGVRHEGRLFTIETERLSSTTFRYRETIELRLAPSARKVEIRKAGPLPRNDVRTGDPHFDARVHLEGDRTRLLAALTPAARARILELLDRGEFTVTPTLLRFTPTALRPTPASTEKDRTKDLDLLASLADGLRATKVERRLAEHALSKDLPGVRLGNFQALVDTAADGAHAHRAGKALLSSPDPALRDAAWAWAALHGDARTASRDVVDRVLERTPDDSLAPAVLYLARTSDLTRPDRLTALAQVARPGSRLANALGDWAAAIAPRRPLAETIALLDPNVVSEVRAAVIPYLRDHGTVACVEPLLSLAGEEPRLRDAARDAVRAIQERLGNAGAGRLTVLDGPVSTAGGLSVAGEAGELSIVEDNRPRDRTRA